MDGTILTLTLLLIVGMLGTTVGAMLGYSLARMRKTV
jgi:hypothetical protein